MKEACVSVWMNVIVEKGEAVSKGGATAEEGARGAARGSADPPDGSVLRGETEGRTEEEAGPGGACKEMGDRNASHSYFNRACIALSGWISSPCVELTCYQKRNSSKGLPRG